ncbi:putative nuclease of restriction endonuclease-like (RecB) superfamily [Oxalobacteraceae bacterium GrIS 2.11]
MMANKDQPLIHSDETYASWLGDLKQRVREARTKAVLAVNQELILLYWQIGNEILERQQKHAWGTKVVERLAGDLKAEFPDMSGFSRSNLMYMRAFAEAWSPEFVPQLVGQLPWGHNRELLTKLKQQNEREWYARAAIQNGWSRNVLVAQIETKLHKRQGASASNFSRILPSPQSELVQQTFKDPYLFDFLTIAHDAAERDIKVDPLGKTIFQRI